MKSTQLTDIASERLDEAQQLDLRECWHTTRKHWRAIAGLSLLAGALTALVVFSMQPIYRSTATLLVEVNPHKVVSIEEVYGLNSANREYLKTQFEILKSRKLIEDVIKLLALAQHPEFDPALNTPWYKRWWRAMSASSEDQKRNRAEAAQEVVEKFSDRMSIEPVSNSQLVKVSFESRDAALAAEVANAIAQEYIGSNLEARMQMTHNASKWLATRIEEVRLKVADSERALKDYLRAQPVSRFETLPEVLNHPTIQKFKEAEGEALRNLSELSKRYGAQHPKIVDAKTNLASAQNNLRNEMRRITNSVTDRDDGSPEIGGKHATGMEVDKSLDLNEVDKDARLRTLKREFSINRQLYNLLSSRIKETSIVSDIQSSNARVVDPAVVSLTPVKPKKQLAIGIAILLGLVLSVSLAFVLERFDNTVKTKTDVEQRLALPVFGALPLLKQADQKGPAPKPSLAFLEDVRSHFAEAVRTIRTGLVLSALDKPHKLVMITSSVPQEGKSTLAMNLALALGQLEKKVLLIDADMRRPAIGSICGLADNAPGLSNLLAGTVQLSECLHTLEGGAVHILPAGILPPNPLEMLSSQRFSDLLDKLSALYQRIVIDSAPANGVSDAVMLATKVSAVLYVVKADAVPYPVAQAGVMHLRRANAPLIGVVLNQVDMQKAAAYGGYGYYGEYYGRYGYLPADAQAQADINSRGLLSKWMRAAKDRVTARAPSGN